MFSQLNFGHECPCGECSTCRTLGWERFLFMRAVEELQEEIEIEWWVEQSRLGIEDDIPF